MERQAGEIVSEGNVSLSKVVDERVEFTFEHQRTCDLVRSTVEHDGMSVAEILCGLCVGNRYGEPEVGAVFGVELFEEGGGQLGAKIIEVDVQICVIFLTDELNPLIARSIAYRCPTASRGETSFLDQPQI